MALSFDKRISDAPLIRFLPDQDADLREIANSGSRAILPLPSETVQSLQISAERLGAKLEYLLLAGFASLLFRMTRQEVITIAVGPSELVQFDLDGETSFREMTAIDRRNDRTSAQSGRTSRSSRSVATWISGRMNGRSANEGVQYEFHADDGPAPEMGACGLRLTVRKNGSEIELASPTGLWHDSTLSSWLGYLLVLLEAAAREPDAPVNQLPLWAESVALDFYTRLNQTDVEFPGETTIPGRFAVQAKRRPEATAVLCSDRHYSYRELDERSTELARRLIAAGAGPNRAVAVCMERSIDLPLSLLAVLKSGAYYLPIEPLNPGQRLRAILEECNPAVLVSDSKTASALKDLFDPTPHILSNIPLLLVDQPSPGAENLPNLPSKIAPGDVAYTIYTSGTTGKPKGVPITHAALLNLICSMWREPGFSETDRTLAVAPISFDIATMDMFLPLCSGGTLVIASRKDSVDPYRIDRLLDEYVITSLQATPATWRMLVSSGWKGRRNLKMISGGEAMPRELANDLLRLGGELWNCYGPTETTIYSCVVRVEMGSGSGIVPIGPPMSNTSFYVMDKAGYPVPPGVPGELYIGGQGVSPGYIARPELTAQRFVPDRFGSHPQGLLFRSGDLVRIVHGDQLEFFGRLDHQVKLRGFRIELGEIEAVLRSHPAIAEAVVVLREDIPGEPRLVAYVLCPGTQVSAAALREHAAQFLPEYMLPSLAVTLEKYPISASGKIDRRALPIPELIPAQIVAEHPEAAVASDALEEKLLTIFREVLRNNLIGVTDSFFRFGGYSLLTVRLFSRIDRELHVKLPISLLFDAPTVRDLARVIRKGIVPSIIVPVRPFGRLAPIFIIQSYLLYGAMLEIVETDRPVFGVREMGDEREPMSVEERARKFAREILSVHSSGPLFLAGWCAAGTLTVEIARQLREDGHAVGLVALFDAERPGFTLPQGPRSWLARFGKKVVFHGQRIRRVPWQQKVAYVYEALERNWDWAVESYYIANYNTMLWLQKRFGISLSEAAFNNVYASMAALKDASLRPYPGKLNLFRAADVPNFAEIDATLGWSVIAQGGVQVNFVPGDHVSMFQKPHVESLAQRLQLELRKSEAGVA